VAFLSIAFYILIFSEIKLNLVKMFRGWSSTKLMCFFIGNPPQKKESQWGKKMILRSNYGMLLVYMDTIAGG
jgi:hypothetical protein